MVSIRSVVYLIAACLAAWCLCLPLLAQPVPSENLKPVHGQWSGAIQVMGQSLRVIVRLDEQGSTIDIPEQNAKDQPLAGVSLRASVIRFSIQGQPGQPTFDGKVSGDEIVGTFTQGGQSFPFSLKRGAAAKPRRPQDPQPPYPYLEESVQVRNGNVTLSGTLTRPKGDGPFPAVVLISGSGPQNRDSELLDHRPFLVLADALTRAGVMVVRYDDRGVGESTGSREKATMRMFASDAGAIVGVLKKRSDVSTIGLIGLSEGGQVAPMLAAGNDDIGFVILLAGPGVSGDQVMVEQNRAIAIANGARPAQAEAVAGAARALFEAAKRGEPQARLIELVRTLTRAQIGGDIPPQVEAGLVPAAQTLLNPWFQEFLNSDPAVDLRRLTVPVLAINGSKDTQVVASQNLPAIAAALEAGKNPDATVKELPGLNHLFQTAGTGGVEEYGQLEETMSPVAIEMIIVWIRERFIKPAK
jgi:pimeloyl-ACP methyl ester carboxylesterase